MGLATQASGHPANRSRRMWSCIAGDDRALPRPRFGSSLVAPTALDIPERRQPRACDGDGRPTWLRDATAALGTARTAGTQGTVHPALGLESFRSAEADDCSWRRHPRPRARRAETLERRGLGALYRRGAGMHAARRFQIDQGARIHFAAGAYRQGRRVIRRADPNLRAGTGFGSVRVGWAVLSAMGAGPSAGLGRQEPVDAAGDRLSSGGGVPGRDFGGARVDHRLAGRDAERPVGHQRIRAPSQAAAGLVREASRGRCGLALRVDADDPADADHRFRCRDPGWHHGYVDAGRAGALQHQADINRDRGVRRCTRSCVGSPISRCGARRKTRSCTPRASRRSCWKLSAARRH